MTSRGLSIGAAAKTTGVSVKTIRYYEDIGLIPKPHRRNGNARTGGNRVYDERDIGRLRFIRRARMLGLGLADIRQLLAIAEQGECPGERPEYRSLLARHMEEIDRRMEHLHGLRQQIERLMAQRRVSGDDGCSWNTCECLETDPPSAQR